MIPTEILILLKALPSHGSRLIRSVSCCGLILFLALHPETASGFDGNLENEIQQSLEQSRSIVLTLQNSFTAPNVQTGTDMSISPELSRLKDIAQNIRINHLLLDERFKLREEKAKSIGAKALDRQRAMYKGYREALTEYLNLVDSIPQSIDAQLVTRKTQPLLDLLNTLLPKRHRPIIGSLPYKHLNYPAQDPNSGPAITPAYQGGNKTVNPDDTANTPEAPITNEIATLAQSLNWQPVAIYEYVKNNIETEWYWGCMKGAEDTLHQKSGNDCDQATLLTALLRASGYPTRYVRGTIEFFPDIERAKNLTGIDDPIKIAMFFRKAGIPHTLVVQGGKIANFQIEHIWVESFIPYANYRGAIMDDYGKTWLGLDTSIKVKGFVDNSPKDIFELSAVSDRLLAIRDEYLGLASSGTGSTPFELNQTPLEYLQSTTTMQLVNTQPATSYSDFLRTRTLLPEVLNILPSNTQFTLIRATNEYTSIPDELVHKVKLSAKSAVSGQLFEITLDAFKLSNQQIAVSYEPETVEDQEIIDSYGGLDNTPAYLVQLRPMLTINRERTIIGTDGLPMGAEFDLAIELISPNGTETTTNTMLVGNLSVIGITAQRAVSTPSPLAGEGVGEGAKDAERLLYESAQHYINRWNRAEDELASLLHLAITRPIPTVVTLGGVVDVTYLLDMPHGFTWKGVFVDADVRRIETVRNAEFGVRNDDEAQKLFMQLSSLQGSILENRIFEDDFQVESISTAKLFQLANGNTQLVTIDKSNIDAVLPTLTLADNIKEDIINAVNQNSAIRIPQSELVHHDWTGIGYLKENPETGESGWMLSGMIAGGMTAWSIEKWNEAILGPLSNPYSEPPNYDPASAQYIEKMTVSDLQGGTVGTTLEQPLQVRVLDSNMTPVKNVPVTFEIKAGGGTFGTDFEDIVTSTTVTTTTQGIASAGLTLGRYTADNPTFVSVLSYTYTQQVGENIVDATLPSGTGLTTPFTALGYPELEPLVIRTLHGDGTISSVLSFAGFVSVSIEDQYANPVSNVPVTFTSTMIDPVCTTDSEKNFASLVPVGADCLDQSPVWGDCGEPVSELTVTTSIIGASAQVILGSVPGATYPIIASAGTNTTFNLHSYEFGNCTGQAAPSNVLFITSVVSYDQYGNSINAGKTTSTIPISANIYFIREGEQTITETLSCNENTLSCSKVVGNTTYSASTEFTSASVSFEGEEGNEQDDGVFTADYVLQPGKNIVDMDVSASITIAKSMNTCGGCKTNPAFEDTITGKGFITVYGVSFNTQPVPLMLVNEQGYLLSSQTLTYTIEPVDSDYEALTAYVMIYKGGTIAAQIPAETKGSGFATISRGFQFDVNSLYEAEVILNYGTGVEIRGGKKSIHLSVVKTTKWLVTHDPLFEKNYAIANPSLYKQAELMSNKATIVVSNSGSNCSIQLIKPGFLNDTTLLSKAPSEVIDGSSYFELRTDADEDGKADTDTEGRIFVEGVPMDPGSYKIAFFINGDYAGRLDLTIKPLLTNLAYLPNILDPTMGFDPYTDKFDISFGPGGEWYGLQIRYRLNETVTNMKIDFRNDDSVDASNQGDMGGVHSLSVSNSIMKKTPFLGLDHVAKWEGFDASIMDEKADEIYMQNKEAEIMGAWNLGDGTIQSARGIAALHVVREGRYKNLLEVKYSDDLTQIQRIETCFGVQYRIE